MECTCIRHTDLPHTSRLFADLVYHPDRVRRFYAHIPSDESYLRAASEVALSDDRRAALVEALREQNGDSEALRILARPDAVAVLTGQQVGLFSGPAYTVYKALTAVKLARHIGSLGRPAVPVFWLATEDHDFAEVNHSWIFDAGYRPVKLELDGAATAQQPVGGVTIANPPLDAVRTALAGLPFGAEVVGLLERSYQPGKSMGAAFGELLSELLAEYGILRIDPMAPAVRSLAAPALRRALDQAPELTRAVLERNAQLSAEGYHAQVHVEDHTSFVFLLENGRRIQLRRHDRDYVANGRKWSTEELMDRAADLSPNALLRPVVQDSMLPTVAYVGGPAELAYLAQSEVLYRAVLGRMPVAVNRAGFTLLDERSRKLLDRYGLSLGDFFHGEDSLRERVAATLAPPAVRDALGRAKTAIEGELHALEQSLAGLDPGLASATARSRAKMLYQLQKIDRKVSRETLARDSRAASDAARLYGLIYPGKHLQERLYSFLPFLAQFGSGLIGTIYDNLHLDCPDHQLLVV